MVQSDSSSESKGILIPYGWSWSIDPFSQRGHSKAVLLGIVSRVLLALFFCLFALFMIFTPNLSWHRITYIFSGLEYGPYYKHYEPIGSVLGRIGIGLLFLFIGIGILWLIFKFITKEYQVLRQVEKIVKAWNKGEQAKVEKYIQELYQADQIKHFTLRVKPWALASLIQLWDNGSPTIGAEIQELLSKVSEESIKDQQSWKETLENSPIKKRGLFQKLLVR